MVDEVLRVAKRLAGESRVIGNRLAESDGCSHLRRERFSLYEVHCC